MPLTDTTTPTATGATVNITVANGAIASFGAITGGSGYVNASYSNVPLTDGTGTGAGATANITIGAGTSIISLGKVSGGTGYTATTPPSQPTPMCR